MTWVDWAMIVWAVTVAWIFYVIYKEWNKSETKTKEDEIPDSETAEGVQVGEVSVSRKPSRKRS